MCVSVSVSVCACVGFGETKKENRREKNVEEVGDEKRAIGALERH